MQKTKVITQENGWTILLEQNSGFYIVEDDCTGDYTWYQTFNEALAHARIYTSVDYDNLNEF